MAIRNASLRPGSLRKAWQTAYPSITGRPMSHSTTSGRKRRAVSIPVCPSWATSTVCPLAARNIFVLLAATWLSSMIRMRHARAVIHGLDRLGCLRGGLGQRKTDRQLHAQTRSVAFYGYFPSLQLNESFHQRQTKAKPSTAAINAMFCLTKWLESMRKHNWLHNDAGVAHGQESFFPGLHFLQTNRDPSTTVSKLIGVMQSVADDLRQPGGVSYDPP